MENLKKEKNEWQTYFEKWNKIKEVMEKIDNDNKSQYYFNFYSEVCNRVREYKELLDLTK